MNGSLTVAVALSTNSLDGLVFLLLNNEGHFVTLGLLDGLVVIQYDFGSDSNYDYIDVDISDGEWHTIVFEYSMGNSYLIVDETVFTVYLNATQNIVGVYDVYIGLLVSLLPMSPDLIQPNGFQGSIIEFQLNEVEAVLTDTDVNIGLNIEQSPMLFCSYVMCANEGVCSDTNADPWFKCECPFGYNGQFCEISLPFCSPNPCNGGQCEEYNDRTFMCSCPLGNKGRFCNEGKQCVGITCTPQPRLLTKSSVHY